MHAFHILSDVGEIFIPVQFRELASDDTSLKQFSNSDLAQLDRIFTHLRRGGVAVLSGKVGSDSGGFRLCQNARRKNLRQD